MNISIEYEIFNIYVRMYSQTKVTSRMMKTRELLPFDFEIAQLKISFTSNRNLSLYKYLFDIIVM